MRVRGLGLVAVTAAVVWVSVFSGRTRAAATRVAPPPVAGQAVAIFAGGCFWCEETAFEGKPGVISVTSGYTGGRKPSPSYEEVSSGGTGHAESVRVVFDPKKTSYGDLLRIFWHNVDPTTPNRQFCDVGEQYRSAIFYVDETQRTAAEASRMQIEKEKTFKEPIVTEITKAGPFFEAEEYHQDYYKKNPVHYQMYRTGCGRDRRLKDLWGEAAGGH